MKKIRLKITPEQELARAAYWVANLKRFYGMTVDQYDAMFKAQNGRCMICKRTEGGGRSGRMVVDHDHATLIVRGLLCSPCNTMLGLANDDQTILASAISYLQAHTLPPT
jgi:hypothetical protein